ncbi:MAG: CinA family nicotinamide mononucleotide deamidase-related protein [Rhodospirillaceae bacterium]|jgi:nicotinamide-nucleotide amidase|nr:CinA family nicotinamide mononucleotide deamidase-related protein [Rhodospirillaceae bacterium]MBT5665433.1 CinA family nicotinamide mononucleotide deamidase-related protein [Rhodospirillaceae bacterium]MBT5809701.1 CinA family nicotinamide mononucleotide deamidase-related protein [Rhodospirillaceae bacterium]
MRCEVVAIGTELLLGQIVDTNSSWIGEHLALAGIDSIFQVKVGDNADRMEFCIRQALERSDAVICCGGLGPTQDDITREVIARVMGVDLHRDEAIVEKIRHMFESRGRVMSDNNRRQADIPDGAAPIPEMPGTAPGLMCPVGDKVIYAVPGVPHEMRTMMQGTILADLQRRSGQTTAIRSRVLRTWGNSESGLAEILADRIDELDVLGNPTLAFQASGIEGIKVRITAKSADEAAAASILASEEALVRNLLGDVVFGIDEESMEVVVIDRMRELGLTLGVVEGLTGGVLAARLSEVDVAGNVFQGALVGGANNHAGEAGASGEDRAIATAKTARETFNTDVGIAVSLPETLVAPPPGQTPPPGQVYLGVVIGDKCYSTSTALPGDRNRFRNYAVINLLNFLRKTLSS